MNSQLRKSDLKPVQCLLHAAVTKHPGQSASTIAKLLGRDRNQVRRALLDLAERGYLTVREEGGGYIFCPPSMAPPGEGNSMSRIPGGVFREPGKPALSLARGAVQPVRKAPSPRCAALRPALHAASAAPPVLEVRHASSPQIIEGTFTEVEPVKPPAPYGAGGPVIHRLPAPSGHRVQQPTVMALQIAALAEADPDGEATAEYFRRKEIERQEMWRREQEAQRQEPEPEPINWAEAVGVLTGIAISAYAALSNRAAYEQEEVNRSPEPGADYDRLPYANVRFGRPDNQKPDRKLVSGSADGGAPGPLPPWKRRTAEPAKPSWLERLIGADNSTPRPKKSIWR
jgi:hypothetical protein